MNDKTEANTNVVPMNPGPQQTQARAYIVPEQLWAMIMKRLGKLPWEDVSDVMPAVLQVQSQMVQVQGPQPYAQSPQPNAVQE